MTDFRLTADFLAHTVAVPFRFHTGFPILAASPWAMQRTQTLIQFDKSILQRAHFVNTKNQYIFTVFCFLYKLDKSLRRYYNRKKDQPQVPPAPPWVRAENRQPGANPGRDRRRKRGGFYRDESRPLEQLLREGDKSL